MSIILYKVGDPVILPEQYNNKVGRVSAVSAKKNVGGLISGRGKIKVRYADGNGGEAEVWFAPTQLLPYAPKEVIQEEIDRIKDEELDKVADEKDRKKLDWIESKQTLEDAQKELGKKNKEFIENFEKDSYVG